MKKKSSTFVKCLPLTIMCLPAIIYFFVFSYITMPGIYIAFVNYKYNLGMFGSQFVGFSNFDFLVKSGQMLKLTFNTVFYNLAFIITTVFIQIAISIMINEIGNKYFKKISQTIMIFPHFVSFVLVGLLAYNFLSFDYGIFNHFLVSFGLAKINVYSTPWIWPYILVIVNLWKSVGYGSIVYFAAITSMDTEIVEAASIDGANAWKRILHITLPHLKPTIIILLLFSLGGILRGNFGLFYFLVGANNATLFDSTDIIETYVFRSLMTNFNFSLASATGLYQSFFGFILVWIVNTVVKKIEPEYSLF